MKSLYALAAFAAVLLSSGAAMAAAETSTVVTQEGNKTITTTRYYYDRDLNDNGIIDSQEFPAYVNSRFDRNHDGFVTADEWASNSVRWYGPTTTYTSYTAWDKNGDGRLDPTEFDVAVNDTKLYNTWDVNSDKVIGSDEYSAATFRLYDLDGNGQLSLTEWQQSQ